MTDTPQPGLATALMDYIEGRTTDLHTLRERYRREGAAADAAMQMLDALRLAQHALDAAPRFRVQSAQTDSYKIASKVDAAVRLAETQRTR